MVKVYLNFSILTVFLKNKNIIFKIRRSKVTDYAALTKKRDNICALFKTSKCLIKYKRIHFFL